MKKVFYLFAVVALVASLASCNKKDEPTPEVVNFKIEVSDVTAKSVHIAVTPAEGVTGVWYWDIIEASEAAKMTDAQIGEYFKEYFDEVIEYYAGYYDLTYEDLWLNAEDGMDEYDYTKLEPNTEYTVVAISLDKNCAAVGTSNRKNFKTLEEKEDPVPADMTFQIAASNITYSSATVTVNPSNTTATYFWNVFETAAIADMSDADLCAAIKQNIEYTIEYYAYFGYDLSYEDFLSKGQASNEFDELDSKTAYTVVAVAMGTLGTTNGAVARYNFATPELVPESEETLAFTDAVIKDYRDYDGSFMIVAAPADTSVLVALTPFSEELIGTFKKADLDLDYSKYYDYNAQKSYAIADAEFVGTQNGNVYSYAGWFVATNKVKYNFTFNVTVEEENGGEQQTAPVKKAALKNAPANDAKLIKKVNLEKGKFVSEKAFTR